MTSDDFAAVVLEHVLAIQRGDASLDDATVEAIEDPALQEILVGLLYLQEDLARRQRNLTDSQVELARARADLERTQRLELIGQLAGGLAHDFNNELAVIFSHAELLALSHPGAAFTRDLQQIMRAARSSARLTRKLLRLARRDEPELEVVPTLEAVDRLHELVSRLLPAGIQLSWRTEDGTFACLDPGQLEQVLMNLVVNARDAMEGRGRLTIRLAVRALADAEAAAADLSAGLHTVLVVEDDGPGMSPEVYARAFEPFFTTKTEDLGTGLGLAAVKRIVEGWGGRITLTTQLGVGTRVEVLLPEASRTDARRRSAPEVGTRRGTVVVVEDDRRLLVAVSRYLRHTGFRVLETSTGCGALETLDRCGGTVDLLYTDLVLPDVDGLELIRTTRRRYPAVRSVLTTGAQEAEGRRFPTDLPVLHKPVPPLLIVSTLARELAR